jgi:formylmethanofuran dehydrogenase subunit C
MREGVILVVGDAGDDIGLGMRRGLIAVSGRTGDGLGRSLIAGSIFAFGPAGIRAGAGMKRGTLVFLDVSAQPEFHVLPTFVPAGRYRPPFLAVYLRQLRSWRFPVSEPAFSTLLERYNGDLVERGRGEIWVAG